MQNKKVILNYLSYTFLVCTGFLMGFDAILLTPYGLSKGFVETNPIHSFGYAHLGSLYGILSLFWALPLMFALFYSVGYISNKFNATKKYTPLFQVEFSFILLFAWVYVILHNIYLII